MSRPWMPFYVADYLADTGHLSTSEHGAYMLLIMHYWQNRCLPQDDRQLARITRMTPDQWADARDTLCALFDDGWRHKRIEEEIARADEMLRKRSSAGKAGASARYSKRIADGEQTDSHICVGEGTTSELDAEEERYVSEPRVGDEFDVYFWPAFPNRVGKPAAKKAFERARRTAPLDAIMDGLRRYIAGKPPDRPWLNPATFLNQQRWADEPATVAQSRGPPQVQSSNPFLRKIAREMRQNGGTSEHTEQADRAGATQPGADALDLVPDALHPERWAVG